jgi:hypothetical protein
MKTIKLLFVTVLLCAIAPSFPYAQTGFQILSQSYNISASWNET